MGFDAIGIKTVMSNHAKVFFRYVPYEAFDEFLDTDRFTHCSFRDFVFVDEGDELFFAAVVDNRGFRDTRAFGIAADVASGIESIGKFFTDKDVPDEGVEEFCDSEEIRCVVFFLPEERDRAREREGFFF
jgi:hypothetical protein